MYRRWASVHCAFNGQLVRSQHSRIAFVGIELLKLHRFHQRLARQVIGMPDFKLRQSRSDRTTVNLFAGFGLSASSSSAKYWAMRFSSFCS
jgi:hypothetical protein